MNQTIQSVLDNPLWSALVSRQSHLKVGTESALRFHPDVGPFVTVLTPTNEAFRALRDLLEPQVPAVMQVLAPLPAIEHISTEHLGVVLQMVAPESLPQKGDDDIIRLGAADAAEMLALAQATKPGPFGPRTHETGRYIGIRDHGRLVAMAGERMQPLGYVEISAVCVDDAYRGRGIAGRLMSILRNEILSRGDTPFLHVFEHNQSAVALYQRLGFKVRQKFEFYRLIRNE